MAKQRDANGNLYMKLGVYVFNPLKPSNAQETIFKDANGNPWPAGTPLHTAIRLAIDPTQYRDEYASSIKSLSGGTIRFETLSGQSNYDEIIISDYDSFPPGWNYDDNQIPTAYQNTLWDRFAWVFDNRADKAVSFDPVQFLNSSLLGGSGYANLAAKIDDLFVDWVLAPGYNFWHYGEAAGIGPNPPNLNGRWVHSGMSRNIGGIFSSADTNYYNFDTFWENQHHLAEWGIGQFWNAIGAGPSNVSQYGDWYNRIDPQNTFSDWDFFRMIQADISEMQINMPYDIFTMPDYVRAGLGRPHLPPQSVNFMQVKGAPRPLWTQGYTYGIGYPCWSTRDKWLDYPNWKTSSRPAVWLTPEDILNEFPGEGAGTACVKFFFKYLPKMPGYTGTHRNNWWEYIFNFQCYNSDGSFNPNNSEGLSS